MISLLYIGEIPERVKSLEDSGFFNLLAVKNVVGFYNQLDRFSDVDLIVSEYSLRGLDADDIYSRYKDVLHKNGIPFLIIDNGLSKSKRYALLELGISELLPAAFKPEVLAPKVDFYKSILHVRLSKRKKKNIPEYKIPLGKRLFDIAVAGTALILLSPLLIATIIAIKLESKGPFWYKSKRVGTGYRVFDFYKLRSMYTDADKRIKELAHLNQYAIEAQESNTEKQEATEKSTAQEITLIYKDGTEMSEEEYLELKRQQAAGTFVKFKNDPRITKVGNVIRNTSIDELPQLINVLKGDMSIVGNRPLPLYEAEQLTSDDWGERFLAPAGITGLWQVEKRGKGEMSEDERKALDNKYAKNFSFWNDIRLILKTIPALFQKENV